MASTSFLSQFHHWDVVVMFILFGTLFGFEMLGVFTDKFATITQITCHYIPKWARAMILGWLCFHFLIEH